jgi:hypothetical protein
VSDQEKFCNVCGESKKAEDFYRNRKGLHSSCKVCYVARNKDYQKRYRSNNRFSVRMRSCRARAKELSLPFNLTTEYLEEIWTGTCPAFGTRLDLSALRQQEGHAQVDRIIPELGYVKGNVVWLSERANRIKDNATLSDLERIVEWLKSQ